MILVEDFSVVRKRVSTLGQLILHTLAKYGEILCILGADLGKSGFGKRVSHLGKLGETVGKNPKPPNFPQFSRLCPEAVLERDVEVCRACEIE